MQKTRTRPGFIGPRCDELSSEEAARHGILERSPVGHQMVTMMEEIAVDRVHLALASDAVQQATGDLERARNFLLAGQSNP